MAKTFLLDVNVYRTSPAYSVAMNNVALSRLMLRKGNEVVVLYRARVGKKTGNLAASAEANVRVGGKRNDRIVGVVTVADNTVVADWKGKPFYYGEYHEEGTLNSKRAKRRTGATRQPRKGYHELREVAREWRVQ